MMSTIMNKVIFLLLLLFYLHDNSSAQTLGEVGSTYQYTGIKKKIFVDIAQYGKQRDSKWCWAACIQMVLNYYNVPISQEKIVTRCFGQLINKGANSATMFKALNGWQIDVSGNAVQVNSNNIPTSEKEISAFLNRKKPLIVGLYNGSGNMGHAYILFGIYHAQSSNSAGETIFVPHSVLLIDPWPGNPTLKDMSWEEFSSKVFVSYKIWCN